MSSSPGGRSHPRDVGLRGLQLLCHGLSQRRLLPPSHARRARASTAASNICFFAELCNECGNCLVFCPEVGDPAVIKPRLYLDPDRFAAADDGQGFLVEGRGDSVVSRPNPAGSRKSRC